MIATQTEPLPRTTVVEASRRAGGAPSRPMLRLLRPHQWAKNLVLFVPLLGAHQLADLARLGSAVAAFVAFSLCASAVYILNDLTDLENDRRHPSKRHRPLACGAVSARNAVVLLLLCLGGSLTAALLFVPPAFTGLLLLYVALSTAYSLRLKQEPIVDIFVLAGLYLHRLLAGGVAAQVPVSGWLMGFAIFFFLSMALAKRYAELARAASENAEGLPGRGYRVEDLGLIQSIGPASGYMAVLTLCLYINARDILRLYHTPDLLWLMCLMLFYWITRVWFLARRRLLNEDPVVFAIKDPVSYLTGLGMLGILLLASA